MSGGSVDGFVSSKVNGEAAEFAMYQEMKNSLQNSSAVANYTDGEL